MQALVNVVAQYLFEVEVNLAYLLTEYWSHFFNSREVLSVGTIR